MIEAHDRLIEDNHGKVITAIDSKDKYIKDRMKHLNNECMDKNVKANE